MATIQNFRDQELQSTSPRLIHVPSNSIMLVGTGNVFEVRGGSTNPLQVTITAIPQGHLIGQACQFSLVATTGHTLSVPTVNTAVITGSITGSDICTLKAQVTYQGLTYESTYTINKLSSTSFTSYEVSTSVGSLVYDPVSDTYIPTSITINALTSENGTTYTAYSGKFTIHVSTNGGLTWGTAQYTSSSNESTYDYNLTGVTTSTTNIRFRLHRADETPSDSNVLDITTLPMITYGYTGSGGGGINGRAVDIYIGSASTISVYGMDGYLASSLNIPPHAPVICNALVNGYTSTPWYRWTLDTTVVSDWSTTNDVYNYTRRYDSSNMPDVLKVEVGDGYSGSNPHAQDYITFYKASGYTGSNSPIIVSLSNDYHVVPFDIAGNAIYTNSGTYFWVYEGTTVLTFNSESSTYPAAEDVGKYNVERTYINLTSGGSMTGTTTTRGEVPDHTELTANQGTLVLVFRIRKLNGDAATEVYKYQTVYKSAASGSTTVIGSSSNPTFFTSSNLPYLVDFTDLVQTFWPGDDYAAPLVSGGVTFGYRFSGQGTTSVTGSNTSYIGSQFFTMLTGEPDGTLTVEDTSSGPTYVLGVACDAMDHPVLFGREEYALV